MNIDICLSLFCNEKIPNDFHEAISLQFNLSVSISIYVHYDAQSYAITLLGTNELYVSTWLLVLYLN